MVFVNDFFRIDSEIGFFAISIVRKTIYFILKRLLSASTPNLMFVTLTRSLDEMEISDLSVIPEHRNIREGVLTPQSPFKGQNAAPHVFLATLLDDSRN